MPIRDTKRWFELAVPTPMGKSKSVQLGVHAEEFLEMLDAISVDADFRVQFDALRGVLGELSAGLKKGTIQYKIEDRQEFFDAILDQLVTGTGCAHMNGMDVIGGLEEVNRSNYSKFVDGKPLFDENGKIKKGPNYTKPDLSSFV